MLQGLYAAASGMEAQQNQLDAVANDLANVDTTGYQGEIIGFQDLLYTQGGNSTGTNVATGAGTASGIIGRSGAPVHVVVGELDWESAEANALLDPLVAASGRA